MQRNNHKRTCGREVFIFSFLCVQISLLERNFAVMVALSDPGCMRFGPWPSEKKLRPNFMSRYNHGCPHLRQLISGSRCGISSHTQCRQEAGNFLNDAHQTSLGELGLHHLSPPLVEPRVAVVRDACPNRAPKQRVRLMCNHSTDASCASKRAQTGAGLLEGFFATDFLLKLQS